MNDFDEDLLDLSIGSLPDWWEYEMVDIEHHPTCELRQDLPGCTCPDDWEPLRGGA